MRVLLTLLLLPIFAPAAEPPAEVVKVIRTLAESLAEQDTRLFLEQFDPTTPGLAQLRDDVESLLANGSVISTLEFESDEGDTAQRKIQIDWVWHLSGAPQHRVLVTCSLKAERKTWKITSIDPAGFLKQ